MTEAEIQKQVFAELRARAMPGVFCFPVANNRKGRTTAGFVAGIPDVWCIRDGRTFALELKTTIGVTSPEQDEVIEKIRAAGAGAGVAKGIRHALMILEKEGYLRPERVEA